jgi:WD40 repeat protein
MNVHLYVNVESDSIFATAATNGAVVIWNLQREGFMHAQEHVLKGHRRAVNRICWHTTDINLLISGSQDGTIKLWVRSSIMLLMLPLLSSLQFPYRISVVKGQVRINQNQKVAEM